MADKKSFIFYHEWAEILKKLPIDEVGNIILALIEYSESGTVTELSPIADIAFTAFKQTIDKDTEKWEATCQKNAENGRKGGRPKKASGNDEIPQKPNGFSENPKKPKKADNDNESENDIYLSSISDDDTDGQFSLAEDNSETGDKSPSSNTVTMSVKEAAEFIYEAYPRKEGKAKGFEQVKQLLKGKTVSGIGRVKFNHCQLYCAVRDYAIDCEESGRETKFIQLFSTFMGKTVLDYVEKSVSGYEEYMQRKYGNEWRDIKFVYQ